MEKVSGGYQSASRQGRFSSGGQTPSSCEPAPFAFQQTVHPIDGQGDQNDHCRFEGRAQGDSGLLGPRRI